MSIRLKWGGEEILIRLKLGFTTSPPPEMNIFTCLKFSFPDSTERISNTDSDCFSTFVKRSLSNVDANLHSDWPTN